MDLNQARDFLLEPPARPAILSSVRKDGRPHAAPIWYDVDDTEASETGLVLVFNTGADTVKGRILRRTGYAALTLQEDQQPFSFLTVEGPVELIEDLDQVRAWATRIGGRYMGADRAEEFGARNGVPGELLVRLRVAKFVGALAVSD